MARLLLTLTALLLCLAPAASAATTRLTDLKATTTLSDYDGWLLYSRSDGSRYHLAVQHDGHSRDLAVPTQKQIFDADAGPDSHGDPSAVVSLCRGSCDLYVIGFAPGDRLRPVRNANTSGHDEIAPSVWRGRLVFGRRYSKNEVVPYTKLLRAPRHEPSQRLAGLPDERCGAVQPPRCRPIEDVNLVKMDLWGRWVGQSWTYQPQDFPGFRQDEIRLTNVKRTDTRQVAAMTTGLGGQAYLGPAFADGRLAFFKACHGDPGGCSSRTSGAFRYRISTGDYSQIGRDAAWSGWTYDGSTAFHVPSDFDCSGGDPGSPPTETCGIIADSDLSWSSIAASHVR